MNNIKIKLLRNSASFPKRMTEHSAGYDVFSTEEIIVQPYSTILIPLGFAIEIPVGFYIDIRPRSGLTLKTDFRVQPGTIDSDYRGEIGVIATNIGCKSFKVEYKKSIAQIIFAKYHCFNFNETEKLSDTKRSEGGFGSTG